MLISDTITLDAPRKTSQGFMVASVRVARTGVQAYTGREVDPDNEHGLRDKATVNVYRPEDEVFHTDSLRSFSVLDVTVDHPSESVTSDNWKQYAVGVTGEEVVRDGQYIRIPMMLKDADAIKAVEGGKRQLSVGYSTKIVLEAGTTADGLQYDAKQTIIRADHLSIVGLARGGPNLRIGDEMADPLKIIRDGVTIEVNDAFIASLDKKITTLTADIAKLTADHVAEIKVKDTALGKAEAERDAALGKVMDAAALDKAVTERADLISTARAIHDADYTGKSAADIRKAVLVAKGVTLDGKSDAYIDARFDVLAEDAKSAGRVVDAIRDGTGKPQPYTYQATVDAANRAAVDLNSWREKKA